MSLTIHRELLKQLLSGHLALRRSSSKSLAAIIKTALRKKKNQESESLKLQLGPSTHDLTNIKTAVEIRPNVRLIHCSLPAVMSSERVGREQEQEQHMLILPPASSHMQLRHSVRRIKYQYSTDFDISVLR